jgi:hypothetical protein
MLVDEQLFKVRVVQLILKKKSEEALEILSQHYRVGVPRLKVGMPKRSGSKAGCYVSGTKTIHVASSDKLYDPYVILHEFYHHLRMHGGKHRGTEKYANRFAEEYVAAHLTAGRCSFWFSYKY